MPAVARMHMPGLVAQNDLQNPRAARIADIPELGEAGKGLIRDGYFRIGRPRARCRIGKISSAPADATTPSGSTVMCSASV